MRAGLLYLVMAGRWRVALLTPLGNTGRRRPAYYWMADKTHMRAYYAIQLYIKFVYFGSNYRCTLALSV